MKRFNVLLAVCLMLSLVSPALAVNFDFHGDFNNRFMVYTNHIDWFKSEKGSLQDGDVDESFGEIKYRLWTEASSDNDAIKGVYAVELGGIHFGEKNYSKGGGGGFSGDGVNIETRWAYVDFELGPGRTRIGLMPIGINKYFWKETVTGIDYKGMAGNMEYELAWLRGYEHVPSSDDDDKEDLDALYARINFKPSNDIKTGLFVVYQMSDDDGAGSGLDPRSYRIKKLKETDLSLATLGNDGKASFGNMFINWDLMFQTGSIDNFTFDVSEYANGAYGVATSYTDDMDVSAYFAHIDIGAKFSNAKLTYTFWYASGDDDPTDGDLEAFISTDVDITDSIVIFEGNYCDDDYHTESPYLLDKGMILNKLALDYKVDDRLEVGAAALYLMTAEEIEYADNNGNVQKEDSLGFELDAYIKYQLFSSTELALNVGYLMSDDAIDFYEVNKDGSADEDIFVSSARLRYKF